MANEIQFPTSPTNGNIYSMGGRNYRYDSAQDKFVAVATATIVEGGGVTIYATIDDLPLSGNTQGDLAHVTANNTLYFWNGSGWYKIALINNSPSISNVNSSYTLSDVGADTVITMIAEDPEGLAITYSIASDTSGNTATVVQGTGANTNIFTITPSTDENDNGTFSLTFRASDGVNIATAPASFTLNILTTIPNSNYTTALITSVGGNNADNNDFVDSSTNSHTITATGNVTQSTFSPYRHGGYSTYFDGSGDYLQLPSTSTLSFGTSDFCIELFVNPSSASQQGLISNGISSAAGDTAFEIQISSSGYPLFLGWNTIFLTSSTLISPNVWSHIVVCRNGTTASMFLNGARVATGTVSQDFSSTNALTIGRQAASSGATYLTGYLTDVRVVKGSNVYDPSQTTLTVPTERLTAIANTSLLTCHLPYIADGSTNGHTITVNGNTKTEPFGPYDYQEYSSSTNGGSMYFDGTGDYVTVPNHTSLDLASNDFTIEFWAYSSNPNTGWPLGKGNASTAAGSSISWYWGGGYTEFYSGSSGVRLSHGAIFPANQWFHVACCRSGNDFTFYLDGVSVATTSTSGAINTTTNDMWVGAYPAAGFWPGTITDFRFVKGTAVYTSAFTPSTAPLTAITNTSVLLSGTNAGIIDKSQSIKDYTNSGSISSTAQTKYLTSSIYFDGVNDYARWTNNDGLFDLGFNGEPFTIEHWHYFPSIVNGASLGIQTGGGAGAWSGSNGHQLTVFFYSGAATLFYQWWNGSGRTDYEFNHGGAFTAATWQHFATVYDGTNLSTYVDGTRIGHRTSGNTFGSVTTKYATLGSNATTNQGLSEVYYSDVRVTKGLARYSGTSFTPPTEALLG